jgi:hypothetical protein
MFAFQPDDASPTARVLLDRTIPLEKWVHVAATSTSCCSASGSTASWTRSSRSRGGIRDSRHDLARRQLHRSAAGSPNSAASCAVTTAPDMNPYYAFEGFIDELRISTTGAPRTSATRATWAAR